MYKKINLWIGLFLIVAMIYAIGCSKSEPLPKGKKAYDFTLKDLDGNTHRLSDFEGKVVILDFWDTWCPPCKAEIPHFIDLHHKYKDKGFVMIGAAIGQRGENAVRQFIQEKNVPYLNLMANMEAIQGFGGFNGIPTTFVIDKEGYIYKKYTGQVPKQTFEQDIKSLL